MAEPRNFGRTVSYLGGLAGNTATGTTLATSPVFDMTQYGGIACMVNVAVTSTGNRLFAQVSTASGGTFVDLAGTWATAHTTQLLLEIRGPVNCGPYVKFLLQQGTSGQHGPMSVFGIGPRTMPATHAAALTYKYVNQPGTGTASSS